ncbi:MAG TPA: DUF2062 domain-containing protein [Opitutaceae bacterium]|nr:DUF2062 domain-containing protein [Opitutaceae bacterium]
MIQPRPSDRASSPPAFWQRRVVDPILVQLTQGITPEKIALTLAVGSACALFPVPATATVLCLVVGICLRLNQPLIQLVNALCAIPHLLVFYWLIRLGDVIFGVPRPRWTVSEFVLRPHTRVNLWVILHAVWREHGIYLHIFGAAILHALVAWMLIAPFWIFVLYRLTRPALVRAQQRRGALLKLPQDPGGPGS